MLTSLIISPCHLSDRLSAHRLSPPPSPTSASRLSDPKIAGAQALVDSNPYISPMRIVQRLIEDDEELAEMVVSASLLLPCPVSPMLTPELSTAHSFMASLLTNSHKPSRGPQRILDPHRSSHQAGSENWFILFPIRRWERNGRCCERHGEGARS